MSENVDILEIVWQDQKKSVVLSPNSLYSGGGGQPPDRGRLIQAKTDERISSVIRTEKGIAWEVSAESEFHIGQAELIRDELFHWEISQQHTAQHIFSGWAEKCYGWKSDGFSIQEKISKIELLEASDDLACFQELETLTQKTILADLPVMITETKEGSDLRKSIQHEFIRIVEIPEIDKCGCGGTHVSSTSQIGGFNILQIERKNKNAVRIWFAAGLRLGSIAKRYTEWEQKLKKWVSGDVEERLHSLLVESEQHQKLEQWFWKQFADLIPPGEKMIEWDHLPISLADMKILASLFLQKGISCYLVNEEHYFVIAGQNADERLDDLKKQGASGGGKGIITGKIH